MEKRTTAAKNTHVKDVRAMLSGPAIRWSWLSILKKQQMRRVQPCEMTGEGGHCNPYHVGIL